MSLQLLTSSRLRTFRACAYKHHLMYDLGWRPVRVGEALSVGTMVHHGLEAYWLAIKNGETDGAALRAAALAGVDDHAAEVPEDDERAFRLETIRQMVWAYASQHAARDVEEYEVVAVEEPYRIPLINPATGAASRTFELGGKIDAVVRERRGERRLLIVEHKTTSDSLDDGDAAGYFRRLAMDAQVSAYYLGAEKRGVGSPSGCLYDVLRKPAQRPLRATPPEARKYTKDGKLYAAQRDADEPVETFGVRVATAIAERPTEFLRRKDVPRTDGDLADFMAEAWMYGRLIAEQTKDARHPRNPDECLRFSACPFWEHCAHKVSLADHDERWRKVDDVHPELNGAA